MYLKELANEYPSFFLEGERREFKNLLMNVGMYYNEGAVFKVNEVETLKQDKEGELAGRSDTVRMMIVTPTAVMSNEDGSIQAGLAGVFMCWRRMVGWVSPSNGFWPVTMK